MGTVLLDGQTINFVDSLSGKDFTNSNLLSYDPIVDVTIYATCFSQEDETRDVFPDGSRNILFVKCNLDNVKLPPNSTMIQCSRKRFKVQNDARDWEIDEFGKPIKILSESAWIKDGISVDPSHIPKDVKFLDSWAFAKIYKVDKDKKLIFSQSDINEKISKLTDKEIKRL